MSTVASGAVRAPKQDAFTGYQKVVVAIIAFLHFTIILDFMILSPLGAMLMPSLGITPKQFGLVVSAYAFSAGASGLVAAGFADSFDRKKLLLFFYAGFVLGTLFCALAPTYEMLLAARVITGCFGGVIGSVSLAIVTDLFPMSMRGRVMGIVQTAFAASQVLGIPAGLYLANRWDWHAPFFFIVGVSAVAGVALSMLLQPVNAHLSGAARTPKQIFAHLLGTLSRPLYLQAFATTALLSTGGFMLMPFGSAFSVRNLEVALVDLPLVYVITGVSAIITGPLIGRLADRVGKLQVFIASAGLNVVLVLYYTRLGATPMLMVGAIFSVMFMGIQGRMIASQALISAVPDAAHRGAFMAVSSCIQQLSGGVASAIAGLIVIAPESGPLLRFDVLGDVVVFTVAATAVMMFLLDKRVASAAARH